MLAVRVSVSGHLVGNLQVPDPGEGGPEQPQPPWRKMHCLDPGQESALPRAEVAAD